MASITQQIAAAPGQPSSVRIGTVLGTNPTVISVQGQEFTDVGFLDSYTATFGDVVALLGQSSQAGTDPTSWLCLGKIVSEPSTLRIQAGQEFITFAALTSTFVDVVFATPFINVPAVTCTIGSNAGVTANWFVRSGLTSNTGFRLSLNGPVNTWTDVPVFWHAIERTQ